MSEVPLYVIRNPDGQELKCIGMRSGPPWSSPARPFYVPLPPARPPYTMHAARGVHTNSCFVLPKNSLGGGAHKASAHAAHNARLSHTMMKIIGYPYNHTHLGITKVELSRARPRGGCEDPVQDEPASGGCYRGTSPIKKRPPP